MPQKMFYQIWESDGFWYWHLKAENQEIIAHGEGYASKEVCVYAINLVKNSHNAPIEEERGAHCLPLLWAGPHG